MQKYCFENLNIFLKLSWHEMGKHDVPAVTDRILEVSGNHQIFYIGYSMGTTQYFVALSEIKEMNDKILAGFMLAPIAFIGHSNSPIRVFTPVLNTDAKVCHQKLQKKNYSTI